MRGACIAACVAVLGALALAPIAHAQQPRAACDRRAPAVPIALDADVSIENRVRYEVVGTPFSFCVERAALPYSSGHGHQPMIVVDVWYGGDAGHYVMGRGEHISWKHFRIDARIDRPHFTEDCGVAVRVHRET